MSETPLEKNLAELKLRRHLTELHSELGSAHALDPTSRELLLEVMGDIQHALEREGESRAHASSLAERLRSSARAFEDSHPLLVATVGRLADTLSNLGI
jgi:uncharacterized membrane protein YccC